MELTEHQRQFNDYEKISFYAERGSHVNKRELADHAGRESKLGSVAVTVQYDPEHYYDHTYKVTTPVGEAIISPDTFLVKEAGELVSSDRRQEVVSRIAAHLSHAVETETLPLAA